MSVVIIIITKHEITAWMVTFWTKYFAGKKSENNNKVGIIKKVNLALFCADCPIPTFACMFVIGKRGILSRYKFFINIYTFWLISIKL